MSEKYYVCFSDLRPLRMEHRMVREGNAAHFECRTGGVNTDCSVDWGEWMRTGTIPNYGDCFDRKPTLFEQLKIFMTNTA